MTDIELKLYNVIVSDGSGCLFQPMRTLEFTYILSSKHLFEGVRKDEDGNQTPFKIEDGTPIPITRLNYSEGAFAEETIDFVISRGSNYFEHKTADACILKVPYQNGFGKIFRQETSPQGSVGFKLYGYPNAQRTSMAGKKDAAYEITGFTLPATDLHGAQLQQTTFTRENVQGMSGGGILKQNETNIVIAGIQSEMANARIAGGQIYFTPISFFNEIVEDPRFKGKLEKLYPPYLHHFSFLRDEAFALDVDALLEDTIKYARITLRNQAQKIVDSNITPYGIKELFKEKLLVIESEEECFSMKAIWIAWLEFLTILNIIKYDELNESMLSDIFTNYRLKFINIGEWTQAFRDHIVKADYTGLKPNANIFISSKQKPKNTHLIRAGTVIDAARPYDKNGFRTDKGLDPFTSFNFVHLDYFQTKCIIEKVNDYKQLSEADLLKKLKDEYNELFRN